MKIRVLVLLLTLITPFLGLAQEKSLSILKSHGFDSARSFLETQTHLTPEEKATSLIRLYEQNSNPLDIQELDLSNMELTELPAFVLKYRNLNRLNLSNNRMIFMLKLQNRKRSFP